ncbi:MAG: NAD(+)/NADH kinase [Oligoflexales bacterium]|nr:NAD(+)/NADH kinase [Oligoflexales bacterium]
MNILVVAKKTNLELHGEKISKKIGDSSPRREYMETLLVEHKEHYETLEELFRLLKEAKISFTKVNRGLFWPDLSPISAVITVGGDGTLLEASHHIESPEALLLGIRSSSRSVGRLCHGSINDLPEVIEQILKGNSPSVLVSRLRAKISFAQTGGSMITEPVLNDLLYANSSPPATTRYRIQVGARSEEQKSSGIWVSTACGSSAAIHAAGGERYPLEKRRFQFFVRELFDDPSSQKKTIRKGFFEPESEAFTIENKSEHALCAMDGPHGAIHLSLGDSIEFFRGPDLKLALPTMEKTQR